MPETLKLDRGALARQVRDAADSAMSKELQKLDAVAFAELVRRDLEKARTDVVWKLLGLDNKWGGKWEVDHCNGRKSPITEYLTAATSETVRQWINEAVAEVIADKETQLKLKLKKAVATEIENRLTGYGARELISRAIGPRVEAIIKEIVDETFEEVVGEEA